MAFVKGTLFDSLNQIWNKLKPSINTEDTANNPIQEKQTDSHTNLPKQNIDRNDPVRTSILIDELPLPTRVLNTLWRNHIETVGDLENCTENELVNMKQIGVKSLTYIKDVYHTMCGRKLTFKNKHEEPDNKAPQLLTQEVLSPQQNNNFEIKIKEQIKEYVVISKNNFHSYDWLGTTKYLKSILSDDVFLDQLSLHPRMLNALNRNQIFTIGNLKEVSTDRLFKMKSVGKLLLRKLSEELNNEINLSIRQRSNSFIDILLCRVSEGREKDILVRRYGFQTGEKQTLDEIGKEYKITRERVRQIQAKLIKKLRHPQNKGRINYLHVVEEMLLNNYGIITDEEADRVVPLALDIGTYDGSSVLDLLSELYWIHCIKIGDVQLYIPKFEGIDRSILINLISFLKRKKVPDFSVSEINDYIKSEELICKFGSIKSGIFLNKLLNVHPLIQSSNNNRYKLYSYHPGIKMWISLIKQVLDESGTPMHFTEISELVNKKVENNPQLHLDVRRAHSLLIESPIFAHSGIRGSYGLVEWGIRKDSVPDLISECLTKAGFPLHWKQIFHYVSKYKNTKSMNVQNVLASNNKFARISDGTYYFNKKTTITNKL